MKKLLMVWLCCLFGWLLSAETLAQATASEEKMSVADRMAKARAAKADKKTDRVAQQPYADRTHAGSNGHGTALRQGRTFANGDKAPVSKVQKGPNGEVVRTGERGAKYYINKNGKRTYLSSNQ